MPDYAKLLQTRAVKEQVGVFFFCFFAVCKSKKLSHCSPQAHLYLCHIFFVLCSNGQKNDVLGQKTFKMFLLVSCALLRLNYNHCPQCKLWPFSSELQTFKDLILFSSLSLYFIVNF